LWFTWDAVEGKLVVEDITFSLQVGVVYPAYATISNGTAANVLGNN